MSCRAFTRNTTMMCKAEEGGDIERMLLQGVGVSGVFMFLWVFVLFPVNPF